MSTKPEKINQGLQDAVNNLTGLNLTNEDDCIITIASSIIANNQMIAKVRGEVLEDLRNNGQAINPVLESAMIGQKVGFMAAVFFEGIRAGIVTYKYMGTMSNEQPDANIGATPETALHAVDS